MQNGCVKKMRGSTSDMISHLPSNVIEKILTCMPIKDAVRTSVLSKTWRYNWVTIPDLEIDDYTFHRKPITTTRKRRTASRESTTTSANEFLLTVCQVLLLHRGPILKFKLRLHKLENCSALDHLIPFVSNSGVRDLILHVMYGVRYKLPSALFSCVQLGRLELHHCLLVPPPGFNGFSKLNSLELHHVDITFEVFSGLISNCPLLEELKLVDPASFSYLDITAPNLRSLYCEGHFSCICLKNAPNLATVSIHMLYSTNKVNVSTLVTLVADLPAIEFLELKFFSLELTPESDIPRRLPVDLNRLKILNLDIALDGDSVLSCILCLIRSSPKLEKINICDLSYHDAIMPPVEHVEEQGFLDISSNRLREVHLQLSHNQTFQLEVVKYLLATSPVLERMVFRPIYGSDPKRLMFCKAVAQFRRLSPLAEVYFL